MKMVSFGEKLRELREKARLTQRQLAVQIRVSKSTISSYETQVRDPSPANIIKIAKTFHVSTDYLLGIDKIERADLSELDEEEKEIVYNLINIFRKRNR